MPPDEKRCSSHLVCVEEPAGEAGSSVGSKRGMPVCSTRMGSKVWSTSDSIEQAASNCCVVLADDWYELASSNQSVQISAAQTVGDGARCDAGRSRHAVGQIGSRVCEQRKLTLRQ